MILPGREASSLAAGAQCIRAGGLLGLPTETVYGLAADADNDAAVAQIFTAKGRPADHPLIVHVADASAVDHYASEVPDFAHALMAAFWPGPLTLILPRRPGIANAAAGGNPTVGLRCPSHPVAQALLQTLLGGPELHPGQKAGPVPVASASSGLNEQKLASDPRGAARVWGLAAPSANLFGRVSPTTAAHVQGEFGAALLILDGGPCSVGIESSIVDCTRGQPVLLRPGAITPRQIEAVCGLTVRQKDALADQKAPAPKASGTLESHYAPLARVRLMAAASLQAELDALAAPVARVDAAQRSASPDIAVWSRSDVRLPAGRVIGQAMPADPAAAAQQLFATLRELDALGVSQIWVEAPPASPDWDGVRDRLQRAAY